MALEWECCGPGGIDWTLDSSGETLEVNVTVPPGIAVSAEAQMIFDSIGGGGTGG
ncbi:MAG: hypothetical protein ACI91O_001336 [Candidatus Poriferisodalaceae bacterium]